MNRFVVGGLVGALLLAGAGEASASSGIDTPDNGVVQVDRGGAFVARPDDPISAYFNPAALSLQSSGVHLGAHLMFLNRCFSRRNESGQPVAPGTAIPAPGTMGPGKTVGPDDPTCADTSPFPNPQIAATFRINRSLAIGLSVMGPHGVGKVVWPESVPYTNQLGLATTQPATQRFLLVESDSLIFNPTVSVSYAVNNWLSLGAGFIWGVASISFVNFSESISGSSTDDFIGSQEVRSKISAVDGFIPGFVVGVFASPAKKLDLAGWFKWQDGIDTHTDLELQSLYWTPSGQKQENPCPMGPANCNITKKDSAGTLKFRIPFEARLGFRFHQPQRAGSLVAKTGMNKRDTIAEDLFDIEMDFTYAHNSVVDNFEVRFPENGIRVNGAPGYVPANADIPHNWKNVFGVRLGGDFVAIPGFLAARAGGFYETNGQDPEYLNPDFHNGWKAGVSAGATVRLGPVDVSLAYQHTFFETLDNGGKGKVLALSGDATTNYRSKHNVNGGSLSSSLNEVALGGTYRF